MFTFINLWNMNDNIINSFYPCIILINYILYYIGWEDNMVVKLLEEIEKYRQEMIQLSKTHGLTSEDVVRSSQKLDELLNEYQKRIAG